MKNYITLFSCDVSQHGITVLPLGKEDTYDMRDAPGPIPEELPGAAPAVEQIYREVLVRPNARLTGLTPMELIDGASPPSTGRQAYLVGSNVWLHAVFGGVPQRGHVTGTPDVPCPIHMCPCSADLDYDIIFSSAEAAEGFLVAALLILNRRAPTDRQFTRTRNAFGAGLPGSGRISHPDGSHVIDAWHLIPGQTITEEIMRFPRVYQRAAVHIGDGRPGPEALYRVVAGTDATVTVSRGTTYPGR